MAITSADLIRAKVPAALCRYWHRVGRGKRGWDKTRRFLVREFCGISETTADEIMSIAREGAALAMEANKQLRRKRNGNASSSA